MTSIHSPKLAPYRLGDLARIPCMEPDPEPNWAEHAEEDAHDLRSITIDGRLVASFGYIPESRTQANGFAVIDRQACAGHGREVSAIIRKQTIEWMQHTGIDTVTAFCSAHDKAARVFLRSVGYRKTAPTDGATINFIFRRG